MHIGGVYFYACLVAQSGLTLCDPMDCSLTISSVRGIFQARTLECVVISFSRRYSWHRKENCISCLLQWLAGSLPVRLLGSPTESMCVIKLLCVFLLLIGLLSAHNLEGREKIIFLPHIYVNRLICYEKCPYVQWEDWTIWINTTWALQVIYFYNQAEPNGAFPRRNLPHILYLAPLWSI